MVTTAPSGVPPPLIPFGHGDDVRHDTLRLEAPKMRPCPAKAGLHFVGDDG